MFFLLFCLMIEGSGSVSLTNGSGSGRAKNIWILGMRIRTATLLKRLIDVFQTCELRLRRPPPLEAPPPRRAGPFPPPSPSGSAPSPTPPGQRTLTGMYQYQCLQKSVSFSVLLIQLNRNKLATRIRIRNSELRRSGSLIFYRKIENKCQKEKKIQYFIIFNIYTVFYYQAIFNLVFLLS
jgi:hypothetical protein